MDNFLRESFELPISNDEGDITQYQYEWIIKDFVTRYDRLNKTLETPLNKVTDPTSIVKVEEGKVNVPVSLHKPYFYKRFFTGPDKNNFKNIETSLYKLLEKTKKSLLVCHYSIGGGVLSGDLAERIHKRCGDNFKIVTDQSQCNSKHMLKYTERFYNMGVPIKYNSSYK